MVRNLGEARIDLARPVGMFVRRRYILWSRFGDIRIQRTDPTNRRGLCATILTWVSEKTSSRQLVNRGNFAS